jgi:enamine deaminase RidA (YjgF/YER057c/UK114 family)
VVVGGQNGVGSDGRVVGDSIKVQTEQALRNLLDVLAEAGATQADVAKLTIYLVEGVDVNEAFTASRAVSTCQRTEPLHRNEWSSKARRPSAASPGSLRSTESTSEG